MAFGELGIAKTIAMNAPKYRRIVEPFADQGTVALFSGMKKPKEHIVNIADETTFALMTFIQNLSAADKKKLKGYDWLAAPETFAAALAINAVDGSDLFYRFFYLKQFGVKAKDPETPPAFDYLKRGHDMAKMLFTLPVAKVGLKKATLTNDDPISVIAAAGGADTFLILTPPPAEIEAVESRLGGLSANYFYAKKSQSNDDLFAAVDAAGDGAFVSTFAASTIMMATMEVRTNYQPKQANKLKVVEPINAKE